jgi:hypothetical protein
MTHPFTEGRLDAAEREDVSMAAVHRRERMEAAMARAMDAGFTERQAPFAAMAWETFKVTRCKEPTVAQIRARVEKQYPWLFEEDK